MHNVMWTHASWLVCKHCANLWMCHWSICVGWISFPICTSGGRPDRNLVGVNSGWVGFWKFHDQYLKKKQENVENQDFHNNIWECPDCKHWYDLIDWDTWFFYENEKIKKGLQDIHIMSVHWSRTFRNHPSTEIQQKWKYKVIAELRRRGLIWAKKSTRSKHRGVSSGENNRPHILTLNQHERCTMNILLDWKVQICHWWLMNSLWLRLIMVMRPRITFDFTNATRW